MLLFTERLSVQRTMCSTPLMASVGLCLFICCFLKLREVGAAVEGVAERQEGGLAMQKTPASTSHDSSDRTEEAMGKRV